MKGDMYWNSAEYDTKLRLKCVRLALSALGGEDRLPVEDLLRVSESFYDYLKHGPKKAEPVKFETVKGH